MTEGNSVNVWKRYKAECRRTCGGPRLQQSEVKKLKHELLSKYINIDIHIGINKIVKCDRIWCLCLIWTVILRFWFNFLFYLSIYSL